MKRTIGLIGCGNMGGALASAIMKTDCFQDFLISETDRQKTVPFEKKGAKVCATEETVLSSDVLILAVKPQGYDGLLGAIRSILAQKAGKTMVISIAAGVSIAHVAKGLPEDTPVIRIMPNTPVSVGEGMILYCGNEKVTDEDYAFFLEMFAQAGKLDRIAEAKIDAASALSGCGPAFVYLFAEGLADGAVECGLARDQANLYAAQTLFGAAKMLLETGKHPGKLKDEVCSPGGTTIAGVHALEEHAFRAASVDAVVSAYKKTLDLKK